MPGDEESEVLEEKSDGQNDQFNNLNFELVASKRLTTQYISYLKNEIAPLINKCDNSVLGAQKKMIIIPLGLQKNFVSCQQIFHAGPT